MCSLWKISSKASVNWLPRSRTSAFASARWSLWRGKAQQQVLGRLGGPGAGRVFGDAVEVEGACGDVDEEQQVGAAVGGGVDGGEVAGDGGLGAQELRPGDR